MSPYWKSLKIWKYKILVECGAPKTWALLPGVWVSTYPSETIVVRCSVSQSCLTLFDPMDYSTPGFSVLPYLPEFAQTRDHWASDAIQPSHPVFPFSSCPQSFPASGSFLVSQLFTSGGQSIRASTSTTVLPMNIQGWFPLGWSGLISL